MPKALTTWADARRLGATGRGAGSASTVDLHEVSTESRWLDADVEPTGRSIRELPRRPISPAATPPTLSPVMPPPARPLAGWYQDAVDGGLDRWWDGQAWTEYVQPRPEPGVITLT